MTPAPTRWREIRAAEDAEVRALLHAAACARARQLMPHLSAEVATQMRVAMLAGPGNGLPDLIMQHLPSARQA